MRRTSAARRLPQLLIVLPVTAALLLLLTLVVLAPTPGAAQGIAITPEALQQRTAAHAAWLAERRVVLNAGVEIDTSEAAAARNNGGSVTLRTKRAVKAGDVIATVPNDAILTLGAVARHPALRDVLTKPDTNFSPTVAMASLLLYEKHIVGKKSPWWPLLQHLPEHSASTMFWPQEDLDLLRGTSVYTATGERIAALKDVWGRLGPLLADLEGWPFNPPSFAEFAWATAIVFARSLSTFNKNNNGNPSASEPIFVPLLEALPRIKAVNTRYDVRVSPDAAEGGDSAAAAAEAYKNNKSASEQPADVVLLADRDFDAGEVVTLPAGDIGNTPLLLDFGQFVVKNAHHGVPFQIQIQDNDPAREPKLAALRQFNVSDQPKFLLGPDPSGAPPAALLKTLRVMMLNFKDFDLHYDVVATDTPVSLVNELRVLRTLMFATDNLLQRFDNATLEHEVTAAKELQTGTDGSDAPMTRPLVAAHVRFDEKQILLQTREWCMLRWTQFLTNSSALATMAEMPEIARIEAARRRRQQQVE